MAPRAAHLGAGSQWRGNKVRMQAWDSHFAQDGYAARNTETARASQNEDTSLHPTKLTQVAGFATVLPICERAALFCITLGKVATPSCVLVMFWMSCEKCDGACLLAFSVAHCDDGRHCYQPQVRSG